MFIVGISVTYGNFFCKMFTLIDEILWPLAWISGGKLNYVT